MKNFLRQLFIVVAVVFAVSAPVEAHGSVQSDSACVCLKDGKVVKYAISEVDSIVIEKACVVPENLQAVDLGLSVKWANMNVGANKQEDY